MAVRADVVVAPPVRLRASRTRYGEIVVKALLGLCALISVATTVGIIAALFLPAFEFFSEVSIVDFLTGTEWAPLFEPALFGVVPLVVGTLSVTLWAIVVALPFGLGAAIYLSEYASARTRKILKPLLELLAGIPTIVYGYFALTMVTPFLQKFLPDLAGFNALSPGIVMGFMIIPLIASLSEDAMFAVPDSLREAGYGLGASKLVTILRVVVPSAWSGIMAAVVLAVSRAIGETMIVAIAAGQQPNLTADPRASVQTMTGYIVAISKGDTPNGTLEYRTIFAVGSMLFVMTLVMNLISYRLSRRLRAGGRQ